MILLIIRLHVVAQAGNKVEHLIKEYFKLKVYKILNESLLNKSLKNIIKGHIWPVIDSRKNS